MRGYAACRICGMRVAMLGRLAVLLACFLFNSHDSAHMQQLRYMHAVGVHATLADMTWTPSNRSNICAHGALC